MNQDQTMQSINTKAIIVGMLLLFIALQIGFHPTYIKHFPAFKPFTWLHHVHGALMASWIILLVVQPILIHTGKNKAHRFMGKLSYLIAPLMIVSMYLILRFTYHKHVIDVSPEAEISNQAPIIMQLFGFTVLYSLGVIYRKHTFYHLRFMIGTAILMIIPIVGRIFFEYFFIFKICYNLIRCIIIIHPYFTIFRQYFSHFMYYILGLFFTFRSI